MAKNTVAIVRELIAPVAEELGYSLWDVEFLREGANRILRITIDCDGGVGIDDCEKLHRAIDPLLDEADPIEQSYYLEVSSPGLGRQIKNAEQAGKCMGSEVCVKLFAPDEAGRRMLYGKLKGYSDDGAVIGTPEGDLTVELKKAAKISLADDN